MLDNLRLRKKNASAGGSRQEAKNKETGKCFTGIIAPGRKEGKNERGVKTARIVQEHQHRVAESGNGDPGVDAQELEGLSGQDHGRRVPKDRESTGARGYSDH